MWLLLASLAATPAPRAALRAPTAECAAAVLPDGGVLVTGGSGPGAPSATWAYVDVYDPKTATFREAPAMTSQRVRHTALAFPTGDVLAAGGYEEPAELFDAASAKWSALAAPPSWRDTQVLDLQGDDVRARRRVLPYLFHSLVALADGRAMLVGGLAPGGMGATSGAADVFDFRSRTWSPIKPMLHGRDTFTATLLADGRVLVAGGRSISQGKPISSLASVELYDPRKNEWTEAAPLAQARSRHVAVRLADGSVVVAGGFDEDRSALLASAERWSPATGGWSAAPPLQVARMGATAARRGSGLVVAQGWGEQRTVGAVETWSPGDAKWKSAGALRTARQNACSALLGDGTLLLFGGRDASHKILADVEIVR